MSTDIELLYKDLALLFKDEDWDDEDEEEEEKLLN